MPQIPADLEMLELELELLRERRRDGWVVDKLAEPPMHMAGCDDPKGKFDWYIMYNPADRESKPGYFHLPPGTVI